VKELRILIAAKKRNKERVDRSKGKASEEYYLDFFKRTEKSSFIEYDMTFLDYLS
jgi:hypothetical protein